MRKIVVIIMIIQLGSPVFMARADEGMWIPMLVDKLNIRDMQEKGFKLTAEDIYSVNKASMKDAVMIFGRGCTGELISGRGLLITNHHCGLGNIQQHSTLEHDYLRKGFWAMSAGEELTNPGLTVRFLKWMEDVSIKVTDGVNDNMTGKDRKELIHRNIDKIIEEAIKGTHFSAHVEPFFAGNQYFLFVEETFPDVRLVGAPPFSIGSFGGDTDNWMWPRHGGDFSLFRIYAGKDNLPAEYSAENVPYKPAAFFPVSLKGYEPGDFTMVFGYPGSTASYVHSSHIKMLTNYVYPALIEIRGKKLEIIKADMELSPEIRIQYATKAARLSNSWKRWRGEIRGLEKLNAIDKKMEFEKGFGEWVEMEAGRKVKYGKLLEDFERLYEEYSEYYLARYYSNEVFSGGGAELVYFSGRFKKLFRLLETATEEEITIEAAGLKSAVESFFRNYNQPTDEKLFALLMEMFDKTIDKSFHPSFYIDMHSKYKDDFNKYTGDVYKKTRYTDKAGLMAFLDNPGLSGAKKLINDPVYEINQSAGLLYNTKILPEYKRLGDELAKLNRLYMAAMMEYEKDRCFYPDANFTLRLSYGKVSAYKARDAVFYKHYSSLRGVIEKLDPEIYDYDVPEKLIQLYEEKDYGRYGSNDILHVNFIATNHTTGGNSGSPVLNAEGQLIGVNFDRVWEGVMSDIMFNPGQCRNISLDIRYALFIIDKFAGAGYLLDEMEIVE